LLRISFFPHRAGPAAGVRRNLDVSLQLAIERLALSSVLSSSTVANGVGY
jgi:hypothetical protein